MAKKQRSFEESLERLTQIVETLESESAPLSEAMKLYEEGILLSQSCRQELRLAELKVEELKERMDGELSVQPFDG
ncbi:MAG: exodeoxyribonuclease VII small subunit [Armatimonadetes bacterium]|nr:exodeoxyribonuclease VII small subunit [Armatimonadota bacterium]